MVNPTEKKEVEAALMELQALGLIEVADDKSFCDTAKGYEKAWRIFETLPLPDRLLVLIVMADAKIERCE